MLKKKKLSILLTICFILTAGTLYTVTYIRPWKEEAILLEGDELSEAETRIEDSCAELNPTVSIAEEKQRTSDAEQESMEEVVIQNDTTDDLDTIQTVEEKITIYVHICGEVEEPGVYEISANSRLNDVIGLAGGLTKAAAAEYVNLAQTVVDGQQYFIPSFSDVEGIKRFDMTDSFGTKVSNTDTSTAGGEAEAATNSEQTASGSININTATREELMTLPGIGESKADAIIAYRETVSEYETTEDIMKVDGIKEGLFQKICSRITVK